MSDAVESWYSLIPFGKLGYAWRDSQGYWFEGENEALKQREGERPDPVSMYRMRAADLLAYADRLEAALAAMN
jgi:hypothetical protein